MLLINSSLSVSLKLTNLHDYYQRLLHGSQPVPSGLEMANTLKYFSQTLLCKNFDTCIHHVHLNSLIATFIIFILRIFFWNIFFFFSSIERSTGGTSRNGEIAEVRRGTDGPLPQHGLQTVVQRPHPADRRRFLHSHRPPRFFFLRYYFIISFESLAINDPFFPAFGQALLQCIACLLPFLDHDLIDNVAYLTASSISVLPLELHQDIVNYLCFYILPFTISRFFFLYLEKNLIKF